ncbi:rRNA processing/ribosome biogenesis-domain-containing protein, partial [Phlebopus sp. FC_14]
HPLQYLLHYHLASDASSIRHAPYILQHLSSRYFSPSPHVQKWTTRITSLLHSKNPGARWAAICIAYRTSVLSRSLLVECAPSWVGIILPLLSKSEPVPILKAAIRYIRLVLGAAADHAEFQRRLVIPAVLKVSAALASIVEQCKDLDTKTLATQTLGQLVIAYPSLHRGLSSRLFALCHSIFGGSAPRVTDTQLLNSTAALFASLHFLGGKVGGANIWRSSLEGVLRSSWSAWAALRTTFPSTSQPTQDAPAESSTTTALNLDKLRCGISAICALFRTPAQRPVQVPVGHLLALCWSLMTCSADEEGQSNIDMHARAAEAAAVPQMWMQGSLLLSCLAHTMRHLLAPHTSRLIMMVASQLEGNLEPSQRLAFLRCAYDLVHSCPIVGAQLGVTRLTKGAISCLSPLYLPGPQTREILETDPNQPKKHKKRRREYQGTDALSSSKILICATREDRDVILTALDVIGSALQNVELLPSVQSLSNRVLLSVLLSLPSIPPTSFSCDSSFHGRVTMRVLEICSKTVQGAPHAMSKITGLVLRSFPSEGDQQFQFDLLLHPRRPPFVRTLPCVESLSLYLAEESIEETSTRRSLGL